MSVQLRPERWLLRCPVDDAVIAPGVEQCPDCDLSTKPLRALAFVAAGSLEMAAALDPVMAMRQVEAASAMVPESENFLLDAGRTLSAAGALESAMAALQRAQQIAPGRKDIKVELAAVEERIDPAAWLTEQPIDAEPAATQPPVTELAETPARAMDNARDRLMHEHAAARRRRDGAELDSLEYRSACGDIARIEIAIAALSQPAAILH